MSKEHILPQGWIVCELGDIAADVSYGFTAKSTEQAIGPRMLRITDIQDNRVDWQTVPYCEIQEDKKANYLLCEGDLVFARTGATVGKSFLITGDIPESVYASYLIRVRAAKKEIAWYLRNYFKTPDYWNQITDFSSGIGQPNVNGTKLKGLKIPIAPFPEQKRIADRIDALQERSRRAKEALEAARPRLDDLRRSVLAAAFRGDLTATWRAQNPDTEPALVLLERIRKERRKRWEEAELAKMRSKGKEPKDDKWKKKYKEPEPVDETGLPELPQGWCWANMKEMTELINGDRGKNYPNKKEYVARGVAFINTGHIEPDGSLSMERMNYISREKFERLGSGKISPGDLVYCLRGATLGKTAKVAPFVDGAIASSLVIIRPTVKVLTEYLYNFLVSPLGREEIRKYDNGSAQPNLSAGSVEKYLVPLAPCEEIAQIVKKCGEAQAATKKIAEMVSQGSERLVHLNQSILAKAFRGELVPQNTTDEPASVLLKRIKEERAAQKPKKRAARKKRK